MEPKPMHLSPCQELSKEPQEHDLKKHPSWVDLITTKQNKTKQKQTTFIHREMPIDTYL
jgi:hypothetical protein